MLEMINHFLPIFRSYGCEVTCPKVVQALSIETLKTLVPLHDGWIIGDDPATHDVFRAGKSGLLKAAVKWGVGVDNVDFKACNDFGIAIANTPKMFGGEVADIAVGYVIALARETFQIDDGVRIGKWPKPSGISLAKKTVALIGYGDIGKNVAKRLVAADMNIIAYDPVALDDVNLQNVQRRHWPDYIEKADFIVITCSLTPGSKGMVNGEILKRLKVGVRIINVGRGPIINESALEEALKSGKVYSAALDVFENEPLPIDSYLRSHPRCIFGSHNASNTKDAVIRTSEIAIHKLMGFLGV
jgi:D-3-phosphoglycerate dehydrogenase